MKKWWMKWRISAARVLTFSLLLNVYAWPGARLFWLRWVIGIVGGGLLMGISDSWKEGPARRAIAAGRDLATALDSLNAMLTRALEEHVAIAVHRPGGLERAIEFNQNLVRKFREAEERWRA